VTIKDTDEILYWNSTYHFGGESVIAALLAERFHSAQLDAIANNHFHNEVLGYIRRFTYAERKEFDADPNILVLKNGILDLQSLTLKPHSPDVLTISSLPVDYDPTADCPAWKKFVGEVLDPGDIQAVQEYCGHLLENHYKTQKAWMQLGSGSNGKDTFDRVLTALLGFENVSAKSLQELESNRFARADLYGKRANIYSDLPDVALRTTGQFKTLTGEGLVSAEKKHQDPFQFANVAKLVYSCNIIPRSPDDTYAFYRRWFITVFSHTFGEDRCQACGLCHPINPDLVAELTTPRELSGILNWCLEGRERLRAQKWKLSNSKSVEEVRLDYVRKSDPVKAFVIDCCLVDPDLEVSKRDLHQAFLKYCRTRRLPVDDYDVFCKRLPPATDAPISTVKLNRERKRIPAFKGLFLRSETDWGKPEPDDDDEPIQGRNTLDSHVDKREGGPDGPGGPNRESKSTQSTRSTQSYIGSNVDKSNDKTETKPSPGEERVDQVAQVDQRPAQRPSNAQLGLSTTSEDLALAITLLQTLKPRLTWDDAVEKLSVALGDRGKADRLLTKMRDEGLCALDPDGNVRLLK
jgi:putative DNA primase/helicase